MAVDQNGPDEFAVARKRAQEQERANTQRSQDAIKRRAASLGNLNSGAVIKQEQLAMNEGAKRLGQANEGIDAAERSELKRVREVQEGRDFSRGEREGSQQFAAEQAALARKLQERGLSIQEGSLGLQRDQFGFAKDSFGKQFGLQKSQFGYQKESGDRAYNLQKEGFDYQRTSADREFEENRKTNTLNAILSAKNLKLPPEAIGAIAKELGGLPGFDNIISVIGGSSAATPTPTNPSNRSSGQVYTTNPSMLGNPNYKVTNRKDLDGKPVPVSTQTTGPQGPRR